MTEDRRQRTEVLLRLRRAFNKSAMQWRTKICLLIKQLAIQLTQQKTLGKLLVMSSVFCLLSCGKEPLYQEQGYVFGTLVEVSVYGETEPRAKQAANEVLKEFQRLHEMLHAWQPSELSELNAAFAKNQSVAVSSELVAILKDVTRLAQLSNGSFNPAIGGLVKLWGFQADEFRSEQPDKKQIAQWVQADPQLSDISIKQGRAQSKNKYVQVDLGGYAKGYALDRAAELLRNRGIRNALINIGGNVLAIGQHGNRPWRVGIQHPRKAGAMATLDLYDGEAIGTSGDYQRFFMVGNVRYCHLINPRTGYPVQGVQAATVIARGEHAGVLSDVASKPLFIAGESGWREAARKMGVSDAMLVDTLGSVHLTSGLNKRLEFTEMKLRLQIQP